jgi:hypothetical protein
MWREEPIFNEMGIPSITYGPPRSIDGRSMTIDDLAKAAEMYAWIAVCGQEKPYKR